MKAGLLTILFAASTVAAAPAAKPVVNDEPDTAVHPQLKSFTTKTVEGGKETFKEVHAFDADGHLAKLEVYRDGKLLDTTEYTWNPAGQLTKRTSKDETGAVQSREFAYTLDKSGRISTMTDGNRKETYIWDAKGGREVTSTHAEGGKDVFEMSTTFDAADRVTKRCTSTAMVTKAVAAKTTCELRAYDTHGQLTRKGSAKYANTYDKAGHLTKVVEAGEDGAIKSYTWNDSGDLATATEAFAGSTMVTTYSYERK